MSFCARPSSASAQRERRITRRIIAVLEYPGEFRIRGRLSSPRNRDPCDLIIFTLVSTKKRLSRSQSEEIIAERPTLVYRLVLPQFGGPRERFAAAVGRNPLSGHLLGEFEIERVGCKPASAGPQAGPVTVIALQGQRSALQWSAPRKTRRAFGNYSWALPQIRCKSRRRRALEGKNTRRQ
jgi:hypothetical protein